MGLTLEKVVVELGGMYFFLPAYLLWQFHAHFDHGYSKKPKETDCMLMLNKDNEHCNQLGFQLNTYGMDLSVYTFTD